MKEMKEIKVFLLYICILYIIEAFFGANVCFNKHELAKVTGNGALGRCRKVQFEVK